MRGLVKLTANHVQLRAGSPAGNDDVHQLIALWAGWRRTPAQASLPGGERCSLFQARSWESAIVPLLAQKSIQLDWDGDTYHELSGILENTAYAKMELEPGPGHQQPLKWDDEWARQPMPHQRQAVRAIKHLSYRALLADDMGLGKTSSAIWAWQQTGAPRVLVVCPAGVKYNWEREIWATLKEVSVYLIDGTAKKRATKFSEAAHSQVTLQDRAAIVINYDLLFNLPDRETEIMREWVTGQFLILDESHYIKNRKAKRTHWVFTNLAPDTGGAIGRLCLTGTPIRNTSEDLWAQIQVIRPGTWSSYGQFEKFHLQRSKLVVGEKELIATKDEPKRTVYKITKPVRRITKVEQLNAVVNTLQVRRKKEDVLDLPEKTFTYPELTLDPPTAKIYRMMREFALIELADLGDDMPIFHPQAKSALEVILRQEQIAQGFIGGVPEQYLEKVLPLLKYAEKIEGRPGHLIFPQSTKLAWLMETIESIIIQGGQPVIFSRFNTPLFWLVDKFHDCEMLHGGVPNKRRDEIINDFQDHKVRVLFVQIKLAEGWNATASQDCIFYGRDWSPAVNAQAVDRLHRIGQKGTVNVQIPIVRGTFETTLHKKLKAKAADAEVSLKSMTIGELREAL